jgi:2-isopropylmalate synthase
MNSAADDLLFDWNAKIRRGRLSPLDHFEFHDETLRDGIQGPSIVDPSIEDKLRIIELTDALGIHSADIGLPGAGARAVEDVTAIVRHAQACKLKISLGCAARTHINDIRPIVEISQKTGQRLEVLCFIGTSPIRQYAESWDLDRLMQLSGEAIAFAVKEGLPVNFVTEDTIRSHPSTLQPLFLNAIDKGVERLTLCDTVGHATPDGVRNLINWTRHLIEGTGRDVKIDWHGHNDRGLGVCNTLFAVEYGADRVHGTALGIGERVGNAALDQVLLNLRLMGEIDHDLSKMVEWCTLVSQATQTPIHRAYPLLGHDAFRTATGVHAAAIIKAHRKGDNWLADLIYSGVPAGLFGKEQLIEVGHQSGLSNVIWWLEQHHIEAEPGLPEAVLFEAKQRDRVLSDDEILGAIQAWRSSQA